MKMRFVNRGQGERVDLGHIRMRLLAPSSATGGGFSAAEFRGSEGSWTIPHLHEHLEESFYILEGSFTFTCGWGHHRDGRGCVRRRPAGNPHVLGAGPGGGSLLVVWTPGGLEQMFLELAGLPAETVTDTKVRAEIAHRYDSVPV